MRSSRSTLAAASAAAAAFALAGTASATPACPTGPPSVGQTITCTYGSGFTTVTVPVGTASLTVDLKGGGGGGGVFNGVVLGADGGLGARVQVAIDATALGSITIVTGAGGARGAADPAGGGGGFSAIYSGSAVDAARVIAVAGGGGGGAGGWGSGSSGGAGGTGASAAGGNGNDNASQGRGGVGGGNGTGGAGGCDDVDGCGASGASWSAGGAGGGTSSNADGDGGSGYGGGGEGRMSGGGAGGSFVDPALRIGSPTFSPGGGAAGGGGTGWPSYAATTAGTPGTVTITFVARVLTVGYDANGATGGSAPSDTAIAYGSSLMVPGNTGSLARPGQTFAGWNTQAAGTGTAYEPGQSLVVTEGLTLYAQWRVADQPAPPSAIGSEAQPAPLRSVMVVRSGVGTTTGTVPAGATRIAQTATTGDSLATEGFLEMARAKTAKGKCAITVVRNKKTKKVTRRTYRCTIRLAKGVWTVTTTARGAAGVVAEGSRRVLAK